MQYECSKDGFKWKILIVLISLFNNVFHTCESGYEAPNHAETRFISGMDINALLKRDTLSSPVRR
jgi:hypothetical protein